MRPAQSNSQSPAHIARYEFAKKYTGGKTVLDVACGDGYGSRMLAENATRVFGVDSDEALLRRAQRESFDGVEFCFGDARRIPFPNDHFDVSVSMETIEHFVEQDMFLNELKRVTKKGGTIIVSTPDHDTNEKMGVYHDRDHEGHGHPGEMTFSQFFYLMSRHFPNPEFYGQIFLKEEPRLKHRVVNLIKKADVLKMRRLLIGQKMRDKYNLSAKIVDKEYEVRRLDRQAAQMLAVAENQK